MNKEITFKLIEETTKEIVSNNQDLLDQTIMPPELIELTLKLSALTTVRILEKLELIGED